MYQSLDSVVSMPYAYYSYVLFTKLYVDLYPKTAPPVP